MEMSNRLTEIGKRSVAAMLVAVAGSFVSHCVAAVIDLPTIEVKGELCYYYDVQPRETIYGLTTTLGVTREDIVRHNPSVSDGLKPRMRLFFPVSEYAGTAGNRKAIYVAAAGVTTHVVKKGETLYGIARRYGMSPDYLAKLNPHVADGLRVGDVLTINEGVEGDALETGSDVDSRAANVDGEGFALHKIKSGETLFSIANSYGVSLEVVIEANPSVDPLNYKAGQVLKIPIGETAEALASANGNDSMPPIDIVDDDVAPEGGIADEESEDMAEYGAEEDVSQLNVAVLLPFMLAEEQQSRTTQLYTEFYKGMLMAADSLRNSSGAHVNFRFYDTAASADTVKALLQREEMEGIDMLVAPDNSEHLAMIMESVSNETLVLNIFAVKDESYRNYRNLIQTNIPHDKMYAKAIDFFVGKYSNAMPVFISRSAGLADKDSFTSALKDRLQADGREYREISFDISLSEEDLAEAGLDVDMQPVVFVPNSGSRNEFARFVRAVTALRDKAADAGNVTIFGYPEWVTFRGESFDEICNLDAVIYSRYLAGDEAVDTKALKARYEECYGVGMFEAVPTQGILGFDTGMYIIKGLKELDASGVFPSEYTGVQSTMKLNWSGSSESGSDSELTTSGGLVNEALYFINYRPGGSVEWVL